MLLTVPKEASLVRSVYCNNTEGGESVFFETRAKHFLNSDQNERLIRRQNLWAVRRRVVRVASGCPMAELFLLPGAQMRRIELFFLWQSGLSRVEDRGGRATVLQLGTRAYDLPHH